jgi:hypothetical protein
MAISCGNLELIRMLWQRSSEAEQWHRMDLLEVAADFHQEEPLGWLLRDATDLEREAFGAFALERRLADALVAGVESGWVPWSWRTRVLAANWQTATRLEFGPAPDNLSLGSRGRVDVAGKVIELPPINGPWTQVGSAVAFDHADEVKSVVLPTEGASFGNGGFIGPLFRVPWI